MRCSTRAGRQSLRLPERAQGPGLLRAAQSLKRLATYGLGDSLIATGGPGDNYPDTWGLWQEVWAQGVNVGVGCLLGVSVVFGFCEPVWGRTRRTDETTKAQGAASW